jgi:hypothetical protein
MNRDGDNSEYCYEAAKRDDEGRDHHLTTKLSDRRGQRASAEADDAVKPITHQTETHSAGSPQRTC